MSEPTETGVSIKVNCQKGCESIVVIDGPASDLGLVIGYDYIGICEKCRTTHYARVCVGLNKFQVKGGV